MQNFVNDLRFALRQLRRTPGFTILAVATLAIGIGSATAVFSLVDTVLLRPLPFAQPRQLVALDTLEKPGEGDGPATVPSETSYPNFFDWRDRVRSFDAIASWQGNSFTIGASNTPARRVDGMVVSADFFRLLGVRPSLGDSFNRSEEKAGDRSAILSDALWQSNFNGDPKVIGQTLRLSEETYTVVGVLPKSFQFPNAPDAEVWITPALSQEGKNPSGQQRGWNQVSVIGRLKSGVSIEQARAEMQAIQLALAKQFPDDNKKLTGVSVKSQLEDLVGDVHQPLYILFASVSFLLLIACANVAGLLLTRTAGRRSELAIRAALGASRTQIVRQLLIESLALSMLGAAFGLVLATVAIHLAPSFLPSNLPRLNELTPDHNVFLFAMAAAFLTTLIFGVLPAWRMSNLDPANALRDNSRSNTAGRSQQRLQGLLVIGETALSLILLVGAGLFIRSFDKLLSVDPGFNYHQLVTFRVGLPPKRFRDDRLLQLTQSLQSRMAALPGVQQSTYGFPLPLAGGNMSISFSIVGRAVSPGDEPSARASVVSANFFQALQLPLVRGRLFGSQEDRSDTPPVVIVNKAFAARFFPEGDALGKRIISGLSRDQGETREIVGIVGNVTRTSLSETAQPEYYIPFAQVPVGPPVFALRVAGDPATFDASIRAIVAQQDPSLPVYAVRTNLLTQSTAQQRFQTMLITGFACVALLLAAVGLYGVLSYMVRQRTAELCIRLALGAQRGDILRLILNRGLGLSIAGLIVGIAASFGLTRYVASLLFATSAVDPITFVVVTLLLLAVSALSSAIPAYRASRLDPNETLRQL